MFSFIGLAAAPPPPPVEADLGRLGILDLATQSGGVVMFVLLILFFFSLASWAIIIWKYFEIRRAKLRSGEFQESFWRSKRLDLLFEDASNYEESPLGQVFLTGYREAEQILKARTREEETDTAVLTTDLTGVEAVERALRRAANQELGKLERLMTFLATTASATPFIGLFGTVWGIMNSFREIGAKGTAGLAVVAPGISEALIATALGLAAAIPAVIAYNAFQNGIKTVSDEIENFSADFLNLVGRHFMRL